MSLRHASCGFIPPHILQHLADHCDGQQRGDALVTLELSAQARGARLAIGPVATLLAVPTGARRRTIYDAQQTQNLPGKMVRGEDDRPTRDVAVNEAFDGAGKTFDFYKKIYERNSIDDRGLRLDATVHYGNKFSNAMWNGQQMIYGDGDRKIFNRFTISLDVIGHELTHGVTQYTANLEYQDQSGALNESFSDVFGVLVRQHSLRQTAAKADWLVGAELFTSRIHADGVRSMKAPGTAYDDPLIGKDPQPGHMKDYDKTNFDNGGVHINSGIPNRAFYLCATKLGGKAWEVAGRIWYLTLTTKLRRASDFHDCALATYRAAGELYGARSEPQKAVKEAWGEVGVSMAMASKKKQTSKAAARI